MRKIKVLALTLALGIAGAVYAAGGHSNAQSRTEECGLSKAGDGCCAPGASCCAGGSCCATHKK